MRKLMWFTVGFAAGCGLCAYLLTEAWILPLCAVGACMALIGVFWKPFRRISLVGIGLALGLLWCMFFRDLYLKPAMAADGQTVEVTITATDYSYETDYGSAFDGKVTLDGWAFSVRCYVDTTEPIEPGDAVSGAFRMRYTPGGEKDATYHPGKGIFLLAYERGEASVVHGASDGFYPAKLAHKIKDILRSLFPEDVFPFTQALLLGDSRSLDYATDTAFKNSGIRHIIAVSGLHVMILYSLVNAITFRKRFLTALIGLPMLLLFAAVAGFTPSVSRACIMVALMILAQLFNREYDPPTALSFAALVMLLANPMVITSVSFQLSVGCVAGIQLFSKPIEEWMQVKLGRPKGKGLIPGLKHSVCSSVSITLGAMSLTTPLSAYYFGTVSIVGILTNLLTLWVVNFVFNGLILACAASFLSVKLAGILARVISWPSRFVLNAARLLASVPLGAVYTQSVYIVIWLVFVYVLLAVFLCSRKRRPGQFLGYALVGLCIALLVSWLEPLGDDVHVTVLDVGQGQSILLQSGGRTVLVDCGGDDDEQTADLVAGKLLSQGISRLDALILTHCDRDHAGGLPYLLTRVQADMVLYPATETLDVEHTNMYPVSEDLLLTFGECEIRIFAPIYAAQSNENSICALFTRGNCDILITGDRGELGEAMLVHGYDLPDVELLIAGHHGSKYSTTELLLEAVKPDYIFVSAGADNPYGHPAQEMLDRAAKYGCAVFRTDIHGTLTFRR